MEPVGGTTRIKVDARVVAATQQGAPGRDSRRPLSGRPLLPAQRHSDLRAAPARPERRRVSAGSRLHGRLRPGVPRRPKTFSADATLALQQYSWPGNVRELRNVIERLMIDGAGRCDCRRPPRLPRLPHRRGPSGGQRIGATAHTARRPRCIGFERDFILRTLAEQQGNMSRTAEVLGVERSNLYRKLRAFGVAPARRAESEPEEEAV